MKKILKFILLVILFLVCIISVNAFDFYGYVKDIDNNIISNANVTLTEEVMGSGGTAQVFSALSNAGGYFNVSNVNASVGMYTLTIVEYSGGVANMTNKVLPPFPAIMYQNQLINKSFYLQNATTINITAINSTGSLINVNGMVFDTKYNFPVSNFGTGTMNEKQVVIPIGKNNYTVMLWAQQSPPRTTTAYGYNATPGSIISVQMNMSTQLVHLTGYLKDASGNLINISKYNFTDAVSYFKMGNFVDLDMGTMKGSPEPDIIGNITNWAWYNLTLLGGGTPMEYIVTVYANGSGEYYAGFQNFTVGTNDIGYNITLYSLAGNYDESGNVNTSKVLFNIFYNNGTANVSARQTFLDIVVNYNGTQIRFTANTNSSGQLKVPLRNDTSAVVEIFNDQFPPREFTYTGTQLNAGEINITLDSLNTMKNANGSLFQDIKVEFYKSSTSCDIVGDPPSGCLLFDISNASNPEEGVEVLLLPGDVSIRLKQNSSGIVVHYVNVDLLGSGPPDMNSDTSANTTSSGSSLTDAWRFGSMGPDVYERVIIGVPYNESKFDEVYASAPKILIANLYNVQNNWANLWSSTSDQNATSIPSTYPNDYSDFDKKWFNSSYGGMPCSKTNTSAECYIDTTNNMIWLRINHFSGLGPQIQAYANLGEITSDRTDYSCYPNCIAYINLTMNNTALQGVQNITVNNTATRGGITYRIEYKNLSNQEWVYSAENNSVLANYNLTLYNASYSGNTTHQFRINISLPIALSTKWNFTLVINSTSYTLDPWLDSINLTTPAEGNVTSENRPNFIFTLYSDNYTVQSCTLVINSSNYGTNSSVQNGTSTTITANSSLSEGGYTWNITCNETGDSKTRTLTVDPTAPIINFTSPTPGNNSYISTNWTEINLTIREPHLDTFRFNWNSTNYSFYDNSLVLALNFNNNSAIGENYNNSAGMKIIDISKYGNNGTTNSTPQSPTWNSSGRFGGALQFDGVNDYVDCGNAASLNSEQYLTVEFWMKMLGPNGEGSYTVSKNEGWLSGGYWYIYIYNELLSLGVYDDQNGVGIEDYIGIYTIDTGVWYHVVVIFDTLSGRVDGYVNSIYGSYVDTSSLNLSQILTGDGRLYLGSGGGNITGYFNGTIDEVRIYTRALSANEILMHYQSEFQKYNSTEWRFYDNVTNLTNGTYTYYGWANDTLGNSNQSEIRTITSDVTKPIIWNVSVNSTPILGNTSIQISANVTDNVNVSMVWMEIDKPNGFENITLNLTSGLYNGTFANTSYQGIYNLTIYVNDTVGNLNSSNISFTVASCIANSDCGTNSYVGSNYCYLNDVYRKYRTYTCSNGGTATASCSYSDSDKLQEDCGDPVVIEGPKYCSNNSVVKDIFTTLKDCNPTTVSCYSQSGGKVTDVLEVCVEGYSCVNGSCVLSGTTTTIAITTTTIPGTTTLQLTTTTTTSTVTTTTTTVTTTIPSVPEVRISRDLPGSVEAGSSFNVTLGVVIPYVGGGDVPDEKIIILEHVPIGWDILSSNPTGTINSTSSEIWWILQYVVDYYPGDILDIIYNVHVPDSIEGSFNFSGNFSCYYSYKNQTIRNITGDTVVNVEIMVCDLPGDYPPCGEVTLGEVIDSINLWSQGLADLGDVIDLINAWATG